MGRISLYLVLIIVAISSCAEQHDVAPRDHLSVVSLSITNTDETGATFEAQAQDIDKSTVIEHGFVWSRENNPRLDNAEFVKLGPDLNNLTFNTRINSRLRQNRRYYVRAFVQSDEYTFLSDTVSFISLGSEGPELTSFSPTRANLADTVVLEGSGLSISVENNKVFFNDLESNIFRSAEGKLWVIVPQDLDVEESTLRIEVEGESSSYSTNFSLIAPIITALSTDMTGLGETIEIISGNPLPEDPALITVELEYPNGTRFELEDEDILFNPLRFKIPLTITSGVFKVVLKYNNLEAVSESLQLRPPTITGFSENEIDYNQELIIFGENFSPFQEKNLVWLDGKETEVLESGVNSATYAGADFIKIKIPAGFLRTYSSRQIGVRIEVLGQEFNANNSLQIINPWFRLQENSPFSNIEASVSTSTSGYVIDYESLYQFDGNKWSKLSDLPREPARKPVTFIINNELYLGLGSKPSDFSTKLKDFWKYSFSTGTWTQLGDFPDGGRAQSMHFASEGLGFVGGGSTENSTTNSDFWKYGPANDSWQQVADYPISTSKGTAAVTSNGVFTGYSTGGGNILYRYDVQLDSWSQAGQLPGSSFTLLHTGFAANNDIIYAILPANGTSLFRYDTDATIPGWKTLSLCPAIGELLFVNNEKVYLAGGFFGGINQTWEYDPAFE